MNRPSGNGEGTASLKDELEALRREVAWLRQVLDSLPAMVYARDGQGRRTLANRALTEAMGWRGLDPALDVGCPEEDRQVLQTGQPSSAKEESLTGPEGPRLVVTERAPIIDQQGNVAGVVGLARDVTAQRASQADARERDRLRVAIETAGAACHELNQPLQAILAVAEMSLMDRATDPEVAKDLQVIRQQAQRMVRVTQRLAGLTTYRTRRYLGAEAILDLNQEEDD